VDGASVYGYALQSPMMYTDPKGLEIDIIWNFPVSGNPFGHCAVSVNGLVWSFGTKHPYGTPYDEYMNDMRRDNRPATVVTLHTSAEQDRAALDYLNDRSQSDAAYSTLWNNCAHLCQETMDAADIPDVWDLNFLPSNSIRRANRYRQSTIITLPGLE
jgi:hypothetical protein